MKWIKIIAAVGMVLLLSLACASIGGGGNDPAQDQNQNTASGQNDQANLADQNQGGQQEDEGNSAANNDFTDQPKVDDTLGGTDFGALLESGDLVLDEIQSNADGETNGRILTVQFTNPSNDEIIVSLPCGLVFVPTETDEQELMMLQPLELSLGAGESTSVTPYVACVELAAPAPAANSGYTIGYLASDQLLKFAECVCGEPLNEDIDSMDGVGVQFAAWSVATGGDFTSMLEAEDSALGGELEGLSGDALVEYLSEMFSMFGGDWLDRCGIEFEE